MGNGPLFESSDCGACLGDEGDDRSLKSLCVMLVGARG
jgi:hypothetical protein